MHASRPSKPKLSINFSANHLLFVAKGGYCDVALFELILGLLGAFVKNERSSLSMDVKGQSCSIALAVHFVPSLTVFDFPVSVVVCYTTYTFLQRSSLSVVQ